jgi:hypothetical protein
MKKLKDYLAIVNTCISFTFLAYAIISFINYLAYRNMLNDSLRGYKPTAEQIKGTIYEVGFDEILGIIFTILIIGFGVLSVIALRKKIVGSENSDKKPIISLVASGGQVLSCILLAIVFFVFLGATSDPKSMSGNKSVAFLFPLNSYNAANAAADGTKWIVALMGTGAIISMLLAAAELGLSFVKEKPSAGAISDASAPAPVAAPVVNSELAAPAPVITEPAPMAESAPIEEAPVAETTPAEPVVEQAAPVEEMAPVIDPAAPVETTPTTEQAAPVEEAAPVDQTNPAAPAA